MSGENSIPFRWWYQLDEAAVLMGMSIDWLRGAIKNGQKRNPPADSIPAYFAQKRGERIVIHRSYIVLGPDAPPPTDVTTDMMSTLFDENERLRAALRAVRDRCDEL